MSLPRLKLVGFIYVPVQICPSYWCHDDVFAWSGTFALLNKMVQFLFGIGTTFLWHHRWFSLCKVPASTQLQSLNDVSHIWYHLWRLCDMLSWSVSLRYQLVCRYDVSNLSVSHTYQWGVQKPSQNRSVSLCTRCEIMMISQHDPWRRDFATVLHTGWGRWWPLLFITKISTGFLMLSWQDFPLSFTTLALLGRNESSIWEDAQTLIIYFTLCLKSFMLWWRRLDVVSHVSFYLWW